jgi:hypothetical protein
MRELIIVIALCSLCNCTSQTKEENSPKKEVIKTIKKDTTKHKTHTMEHFNIKDYENLKKDPEFSNKINDNQYILDDKRIRIWFDDEIIKVEEASKTSPYEIHKTFYAKNKSLKYSVKLFYDFQIGVWLYYNEQGKLLKETNSDLPYKFSIEDLKKKMLKEHDIDIMDVGKMAGIRRFVIHEHSNTAFYEVYVKTGKPNEVDQYVIHGTTGEMLFTDTEYRDEKGNSPYERYLNKETRKENLHTRYKGKDYTRKEWEAYQKTEEYKKALEEYNKKGLWDKLFGN